MTRHESIILALMAALGGHSASEMRNTELPQSIPPQGLVNVVPGDPVEQGIQLGTGRREWQRPVELEHVVANGDATARSAALDAVLVETASILDGSDLDGSVDYLLLSAPVDADDVPIEGAASIKGAVVEITLFYETSSNPMETIT